MRLLQLKRIRGTKCIHRFYCGDIRIPLFGEAVIKTARIRSIFYGMIRRCYSEQDGAYKTYGARGIRVCQEWLNNPRAFELWSLENNYNSKQTIDRIDSDKDYSPENCRWINRNDNARFKKGTNYINKMLKQKGMDETVKYIEERLSDKRES